MYIQNIFTQLKYTTNPTGVSLLAFTNSFQCTIVLSLAGPRGGGVWPILKNPLAQSLSHTHSDLRKHTHTKTRHNELNSDQTLVWTHQTVSLVISTVQKRRACAIFHWETLIYSFLEEMGHCSCHLCHHHHLLHSRLPYWPISPSPVITSARPKSTKLHMSSAHGRLTLVVWFNVINRSDEASSCLLQTSTQQDAFFKI